MNKIEYLGIDFDAPPHKDQLTQEFGAKGWNMVSMLPILVPPENGEAPSEENPPLQKLRAYFTRETDERISDILVPVGT